MTNKTVTVHDILRAIEGARGASLMTAREIAEVARRLNALAEPAAATVQGHHPSCRAVDEYKPGDCSHGCEPVPPAGYAPCSPELLESGVDCATAPRWSSPTWDGHSHWHPVPPAGGEPEVLGYLSKWPDIDDDWTIGKRKVGSGATNIELVDRAHVTRLQAEVRQLRQHKNDYMEAAEETRKALQAEVDKAIRNSHEWRSSFYKQQSELTNARELFRSLRLNADPALFSPGQLAAVDEFISNQSAPADKGQGEPVAMSIPSEDELIASGLGYPFSKEEAVQLYYSGFKTEPITVLEAWDAIGHDIGCNPSKDELLDSLRNMAAICDAHGNDMPAEQPAPVAVVMPEKYDDVLLPFLSLMRAELHANAHKGDRPGWLQMDRKTAVLEVFYHMGKLHQAVHRDEAGAIKEYAADVANMCMMLTDVCGYLNSEPNP